MKFSLLITASPYGSQAGDSAWHFARAVLDGGHELYRVFFFLEGVYHGNALSVAPQDEVDRTGRWAELADEHGVDLVLCVASAAKRGVLDSGEADRHEKPAANARPGFEASGLGQLIDAHLHSDRLVAFGD